MYDDLDRPPPGQMKVFIGAGNLVFLGWDGWSLTTPIGISAVTTVRRMERFSELYGPGFDLSGVPTESGGRTAEEPGIALARALGLAVEKCPLRRSLFHAN